MTKNRWTAVLPLIALVGTLGVAAQTTQENRTLIVRGHAGQLPVIQVNGRSYVEVEALAQLMNGSVAFKGNQITLTLPASAASAPPSPSPASQAVNSAFSKDFLNAGIETMSVIREWRSALVSAIQNGYPVTDASVAGYRAQATKNLRFSFVAQSTDADRSAYALLSNELDTMQKFSNSILAAHKDMENISVDTIEADPLNQQILSCSRSLVAMASAGVFRDDGSCH
jgi:hypothetical protein